MQAGPLRHRIVIQSATEAQDAEGEPIPTWATFLERWASVMPLEGREMFNARQLHAEVTHEVHCRHAAGVTPKMRIVFGVRVFDVLSVRNLEERDRETVMLAKERV